MSSDLAFITNNPGQTVLDRLAALLKTDTRFVTVHGVFGVFRHPGMFLAGVQLIADLLDSGYKHAGKTRERIGRFTP